MAGLYLHIPFCSKRCLYCDFYSNTDMSLQRDFVSALCKEMEMRKEYLDGEEIKTIYFGGGTPSQLSAGQIEEVFNFIYRQFNVAGDAEVTLEANPDDMTAGYAASLSRLPINRISMGVQSFNDKDLLFLQRRHTKEQAVRAVSLCKENGIENISIDLIYGLPGQTAEEWEGNLSGFLALDIPHLSAYHIIYEEGTRLYQLKEIGDIHPVDEETSTSMFETLINRLAEAGYQHYEISNFARPGRLSKHNSSYWTGEKYLGVGPSAHSYNRESRQWNVSSIHKYIHGMAENAPQFEIEMLNIYKRYNDYIITGLRTMWGIDLFWVLTYFGQGIQKHCIAQAESYINRGLLVKTGDKVTLSRDGMFVSDMVMSDLMWV